MKHSSYWIRILAVGLALVLLGGCAGQADTAQDVPPLAQSIPEGSFGSDNLDAFAWALLQAVRPDSGNVAISPVEVATVLAMVQSGAADALDAQIITALGAQEISPKRVNEYTLQRRQVLLEKSDSPAAQALRMMVGENQPVLESYIKTVQDELGLQVAFEEIAASTANAAFAAWADDNTMGLVNRVRWELPAASMPYIISVAYLQNYWQTAQDPARTTPVSFTYEDGSTAAVPMVPVVQSCGIYRGQDGSMGILPLTDDNFRLVLMIPGEEKTLDDLLGNIVQYHAQWRKDADWGEQRIAVPKFAARFDGSLKQPLDALGVRDVFRIEAGLPRLGNGMYLADVLASATFVLDESGTAERKDTKPFRPGMDDGIVTLLINRPFVFAVEDAKTGLIIQAGIVKDPMLPLK
ncbi:MAG: serpin family protein [Eubacteriales bacterium]|nr:serpin family protein [Eubacteriales bacterium]